MASNILSGERRWSATRKSSMTILGKVPKPVNLPSQRLENHGLDPNVEIVPKGTLTWGKGSSSATPNAWSSSTLLSPKTDGSTGSPSHYSGRPSSGGSGTRPSTAGSDRSQDPSPIAWGSNSCPSTASGLLPSNQTPVLTARPRSAETRPLVAARPRSAETRPGSSQLSRFAENSGEPAVAWGIAKTAEKLGVASSRNDEFSLSSGDFPTLGSEKKTVFYSQQGPSSQEHSDAPSILKINEKLQLSLSGDDVVDHENVSLPRTERSTYYDDNASLNKDLQNNRQMAQMYEHSKMTSNQFDSWHGPPVHQPDGVWYRGGSFRPAAVTPGGFPGDHFVCYPHPFPPNSEAVPRPGARPSHYQPTNGEPHCSQVLPNSYILPTSPVIATRPGPFKNAGSYDGYDSHHKATFYDSAEQRIPSTGVANQPSAFNRYLKHTGGFTSVDVQNGSDGENKQIAETQLASGRNVVPYQGPPYKVLLKPHANVEGNHSQEKDHFGSSTLMHSDVEHKRRGSISEEGEHSTSVRKNEITKLGKLTTDHHVPSKLASDDEPQPSNLVNIILEENSGRSSEGILKREPDNATAVVKDRKNNAVRKNAALIEKIEGLNNKIRSGDNISVAGELSVRQERTKQVKVVNAKPKHSATSGISTMSVSEGSCANVPKSGDILLRVPSEGSPLNIINNPKPSDSTISTGQSDSKEFSLNSLKPDESGSHVSKRIHAAQNRGDHHSKSKLDDQSATGWTQESSGRDSSVSIEKKVTEEAILTSSSDSLDRQAERSKLKEMAAQRAKQLLKEEEERTRDQKAKALAKLEELNRRSTAQIMKQKSSDTSSPKNNVQHLEDSGVDNDSSKHIFVNPPGVILVENSGTSLQMHNDEYNKHRPSASQHSEIPVVPMSNESNATETVGEVISQTHATGGSKQKHMGFRRWHKAVTERSSVERQIVSDNSSSKHLDDVVDERNQNVKSLTSEKKESSRNLGEANTHGGDSSLQQKKKSSRNSRNKSKDEGSVGSGQSSSSHSHDNVEEHLNETFKSHPASSVTETSLVNSSQDSGDSIMLNHKEPSKVIEEAHGRMSNQWKQHQPSRRPARNQQVNRPLDKVHGSETVIWAPVKPANKNDQSEEICHSTTVGSNSQPMQRNDHDMHCGTRTKRAEMERYVPKPVAKELLQQENTRKPSKPVDQSPTGDIPEKFYSDSKGTGMVKHDGSSIGRIDFVTDAKNGVDNKPSRRGRAHASWRQRSSESTLPLQSSNEISNSSDATKPCNKPSDQHPPLPEQLRSGGWEISSNPVAKESDVSPSLTKDQVVASRQNRQQAHRTIANHCGNPDGKGDKSGSVAPLSDTNETDTRNGMKGDNNKDGASEFIRSHSHWKPKSQAHSHNPLQHSLGNENNSNLTLKDVPSAIKDPGHQDNAGANMDTCDSDLSKELLHFPKPVVQTNAASNPAINAQQENHISSQRRHGHRGGRFNRGQEATYRSSGSIQMNEDQRKNNSHLGYQPVGSFNKESNLYQSHSNNDQETQGHPTSRQRYKEGVQSQTRNVGRFVRRNTGF